MTFLRRQSLVYRLHRWQAMQRFAPFLDRPKAAVEDDCNRAWGRARIQTSEVIWEDVLMSRPLTPIRRRTLLKAGLACGASQIVSAPFVISALGDEPVKIGMVDPLTGVLSALAQSEVDGARYAEAEINKNGGILGRPVQLLVEDSANDVGTGVQKTRKLIDRDQVNVIFGDVNSGIAYAMSQVTNEKKVFHIVGGGHTDPITG